MWNMEKGNTRPSPQNRTKRKNIFIFCMRQFCLPYVFRLIRRSQRAHASGALASSGSISGEKKIMQKRIAASQINE